MKRDELTAKIAEFANQTTSFDFPFLADEAKKLVIINEKKMYIEEQLKQVAPALWPDSTILDKVWQESLEYADSQFASLPEKRKLNGFYLQELMHTYSNSLGQIIISRYEEKRD